MNSQECDKLALLAAASSPCEKRKVGAVIIDADYINERPIASHNSHPTQECCEDIEGNTIEGVIHAEVAALNELVEQLKLSEAIPVYWFMHVTHQPCQNCVTAIRSVEQRFGIKIGVKVVEQFMKFDTDKPRYDLIPPSALRALADVLTYGAKKYKPNNWKNGDKDRYIAALYRHLEAWRTGEQCDDESGMKHLAHALTNVAFLLELDNEE